MLHLEVIDPVELRDMLAWYELRFPDGAVFPVLKSLVFFDDAEDDPMPNMLQPCDWGAAKQRIAEAVASLCARNAAEDDAS